VGKRVSIKTARDAYRASALWGEASGAAMLRELAGEPICLGLWRAFRSVTLWAGQPPQFRRGILHGHALHATLVEAAGHEPLSTDDPRGALVLILGELAEPEPDVAQTAFACLVVADWALGRGAVETAMLFSRAAALVGGTARYAWLAGRLHREHSRMPQAEIWFQAAFSIAGREHDWDTKARALMSWGKVYFIRGRYGAAREHFERALAAARYYGLDDRIGEAHHDLFAVGIATGDDACAEEHSRAAVGAYGSAHPRLPYFAHDLACYWMDRGDCRHALELLVTLLEHHFQAEPASALLVCGSALRAAGGCGDAETFDRLLPRMMRLGEWSSASPRLAQAMLLAGRGAASLRRWVQADELLATAIETADERGQSDTRVLAEDLLQSVRQQSYRAPAAVVDPANAEISRDAVRRLSDSPARADDARAETGTVETAGLRS
jgi:tetratricopeptide (TPR) repeat protein